MNYVPPGYLTSADAAARVFQAQHPDLAASASARKTEMQRLERHYRAEFPGNYPPPATLMDAFRLRAANSARRARIMGAVTRYRRADSKPEQPGQPMGTFGEEDLARLRELYQIETEQRRFESEAEMKLRSALAEGDLPADVLTDTGAWVPLDRSPWLGKDGLTTVRRSRLRVQVPGTHTPPVDGTVIIKEDHLMNWIASISSTNGERVSPSADGLRSIRGEQLDAEKGAEPPVADRQQEGAPAVAPELPPPEFIDLKSEPPRPPRYTIKGPLPRATKEQVDECIKKIAELDGGKTNRRTIRDWGRHWLRTARQVDTDNTFLETRFNDPKHKERRRPGGNLRNAG